ncbi:MAG: tail fiber domain-containing protein [Bacteroidetes bacterium]|nr:tail fiber domain-containing protein [Bacteroidota bacterium]
MKKIAFIILLALIAFKPILSQSPQAFKYQAVARDNAGNSLSNQLVSFRMSVLQGSATGTSVYTETHQTTTNGFGLANLEIGNGSAVSGSFGSIDWSTGIYFLKIEMDPSGGSSYQLMGSSQLLSVPYALYSENTANPGDNDWTVSGNDMYSNATGNVAIGTTINSTYAKLSVGGHIAIVNSGRSVFIGNGAGLNDDLVLNDNVFIGDEAGSSNTTGSQNIALGRGTFGNNISGFENTALGSGAMYDNIDGTYNTALGRHALYSNTSGSKNVALGYRASYANELGASNTAIGSAALQLIDGSNNTAIGFEAGKSLIGTTMNGGVFLGYQAGKNEITSNKLYIENSASATPLIYGEFDNDIVGINGHLGVGTMSPSSTLDVAGHITVSNTGNSVFIGQDAGLNDDFTANNNVFIGYLSGTTNTSGYSNSALGEYSMNKNTNGFYNTAVGSYALYENTIGVWNTAIGRNSMKSNINGTGNVAIGGAALASNETGDNNTIIGASAGSGAPDLDGCVFIGHGAGSEEYSDNRLHIGNSYNPLIYGEFDNDILSVNGKLGIATETPAVQFQVVGGTDASLASGGYLVTGSTTGENIVMDENEIMARNNGVANTLHLQRDGGSLSLHYGLAATSQVYVSSSGWTGIGTNAPNTKLNVNTATGEDAFRVQINYSTKLLVTSGGAVVVGYNNSSPTFALQLQNSSTDLLGRGLAYSWTIYSDDRLKSNQKQLEYGLKEVMQLQPKSYDHHSSDVNEEGIVAFAGSQKEATIGFIAQEVQQIIPEAVYEPEDDSKNLWGMDYEKLIPVLTKAIQEQQAMIEQQQGMIEALQSEVNNLKSQ